MLKTWRLPYSNIKKRHFCLLKLCFDQYFLTHMHIFRWMRLNYPFNSNRSCWACTYRLIKDLKQPRLIEEYKFHIGAQKTYQICKDGIGILKLHGEIPSEFNYNGIDHTHLNHNILATDIRLVLEKIFHFAYWTSDRVLRACQQEEKIPDAVIEYSDSKSGQHKRIAIEVEITRKSQSRYHDIFAFYDTSDYDLVLYFVEDDKLKRFIKTCFEPITQKAFVCTIQDFLNLKQQTIFESPYGDFILGDYINL